MRIILDMDEVIVDNYAEYRRQYRELFGEPVDEAAYHGKKIYQLPGAEGIRDTLYEKGHFRNLPAMPGALAGVKELYDKHEVWIVTACMEFRHSFLEKYEWIEEHLPFFPWQRIYFCGDKRLVTGDYMVDDKVRNLKTFDGTGVLFSASHNAHDTGYHRVNDWAELLDYFREQERAREALQA